VEAHGRSAPRLLSGLAARPAALAGALWRFSRPHTLVGTWTSILAIYAIATATLPGVALGDGVGDLVLTLVAGAAVNVFITGLNQLEDVEIDRINKPFLPLAAGELSMTAGRAIVAGCGLLALAMAVTQGWVELVAVAVALAIGAAYSSPPLRLKRFPVAAAASITLVRSLAVNVGVYQHFAQSLGDRGEWSAVPGPIVALTLFVLPFAFAIAVLKDVPDAEGDRRFRIRTFSVRLGARRVMTMGMAALTLAFGGMAILGPLLLEGAQPVVLAGTHLLVLAVLVRAGLRADPADPEDFTRFYMAVWKAFFLEYVLVPLAYVV
jgi:homogentisate phytyltransferase / homogentisate geranylgeranyltransferase